MRICLFSFLKMFSIPILSISLTLGASRASSASTNDSLLNVEERIYKELAVDTIWYKENELKTAGKILDELAIDLGLYKRDESINNTVSSSTVEKDKQLTRAALQLITVKSKTQKLNVNSLLKELIHAVDTQKLITFVHTLTPQHVLFTRYRDQLNYYQAQMSATRPHISPISISMGQRSPEIIKLRKRLMATGDLKPRALSKYRQSVLDPSLILAIKSYQYRHNIEQTGRISESTLASLNFSPQARIEDIRASLHKIMRLSYQLPKRFIWINIPSFSLTLIENEQPLFKMRVIVGKASTPTPEMTTLLQSFTINPTWRPPSSIIYNELVDKHNLDPNYLHRNDFIAKPYAREQNNRMIVDISKSQLLSLLKTHQLVQMPGQHNALGKYRFNIRNNQAIYLHDTPARNLFNLNNRSLSHGCIRLERPEKLAQYLIGDNHHRLDKLNRALGTKEIHQFTLDESIAVFITDYTHLTKENKRTSG